MNPEWIIIASLGIAMSAAVLAGVFLAFSDFIMRALVSVSPIGGARAMQAINVTVLRSVFLTTFFALVPATVAVSLFTVWNGALDATARTSIALATAVYLLSVIGVTVFGNVPMNERLAGLDASQAETVPYWRHYGVRWTRLNHLRTLGSLATAVGFLFAAARLL